MPTTIPYQSPETLLFIAGIAVIWVVLLFAERSALRRTAAAAHTPWQQRFSSLLGAVGSWWLLFGASGLLIPLFFTVVLGYSSGNANGDLSILMGQILVVAGVLALVTMGLTLVLLLTGGGLLLYLHSSRRRPGEE